MTIKELSTTVMNGEHEEKLAVRGVFMSLNQGMKLTPAKCQM